MGVAFNNIPMGVYYQAALMYYNGVKITLSPDAVIPSSSEKVI